MKTIISKIFILFVLFSQTISAQWTYEIISRKPINYSQIKFFNEKEGYVIGEGILSITNDGGINFKIINNYLPSGSVYFQSTSFGWIAGNAGKVWKTADSGKTWSEKWANTVYDFYDVTFIDSLTGWAVGNGGTIRKTTDGGENWFSQTSGREPDWSNILKNVRFMDKNVGIISTNNTNYILKTTDGGSNWIPIQFGSSPANIRGIIIWDSNSFLILDNDGSNYYISKTTDAGVTWTKNNLGISTKVLAAFNKSNYVTLETDLQGSRFRFTTNGGINWSQSTGIPAGTAFSSLCLIGESNGFACGDKEILYTTNDGGQSWNKLHSREEIPVNLNSVHFADSSNGWIVGESGLTYKTTDAGDTWTSKNIGSSDIYDVQFLTPNIGWICGNGFVSKTTDGGNTFLKVLTEGIFYDVTYTDENNGFLIKTDAWNVAILKTTDKGTNWRTVLETQRPWPHSKLFALNKNIIWAPLRNGLSVSRDGGLTWEGTAYGYGLDFSGAYFFDEQHGFVTKSYYCLRTNDGGASWGEIPTISTQKTPPHFGSKLLGCFLTREGNIFATSDGGFTWQLLTKIFTEVSDYNYWLNAVYFNSENTAWIVGDLGTIIKITYENPTEIKEPVVSMTPYAFSIYQNYPNPFNPRTKIKYSIPASLNPSEGGTLVSLKVYDLLGREVITLVNEEKPTGNYEIEFDGSNLPSGVYFYQLNAGNFVETKKMILMR